MVCTHRTRWRLMPSVFCLGLLTHPDRHGADVPRPRKRSIFLHQAKARRDTRMAFEPVWGKSMTSKKTAVAGFPYPASTPSGGARFLSGLY
jgi:hypothetical protein